MTATLTDRYITATVRSLPEALQTEVRDELRASIADAVDARTENGEPLEHAERAVLTELGDPGVLAAGYADRPLHLIGPKYYLTWWRLLKILLAVVPACAIGGVAIAQALSGANIGVVIGESIAIGLSVIVHVSFWTTLVFFVLERTGADTGARWSVDQLPEESHSGTARADLIASLVMLALFAGLLLWDQLRGWLPSDDAPMSILNPALWPWGIGALIALLVVEAGLALAVFARGRWTMTLAWINAAIAVCVMSLGLTALGRGVLFNPRFVDEVFVANGVGGDAVTVLAVLSSIAIVGITVGDMVDGWRKAARSRLAV
ncbi:permease prefix domain 1-containing protein [Microbacterium esteraromaticum]|uniref:permease prefix domain 1-containing protein n=1 Tax=Microbacterium esteraromaticum TaxID=57043 RepID=UPI001957E762|nr:permease prefix domain 1-containing protein [Microbacterium esteraromaticum]MBM7466638.1 hypothetical protein [Microbacterium esteraromaticum]